MTNEVKTLLKCLDVYLANRLWGIDRRTSLRYARFYRDKLREEQK